MCVQGPSDYVHLLTLLCRLVVCGRPFRDYSLPWYSHTVSHDGHGIPLDPFSESHRLVRTKGDYMVEVKQSQVVCDARGGTGIAK